jgi:prophage regulatory protein
MNQRLIRLPQVKAMVGLGRSSIYDRIKKSAFPQQIKLGRSSGWVEAEVQVWISEQIQASRPEQVNALPNSRGPLPAYSRCLPRGSGGSPEMPPRPPD